MNLEAIRELALNGRLYPAVILHGGSEAVRREAALELGRCLLCELPAEDTGRPCGECRHCGRIAWPSAGDGGFHPDFQVLERDLKTSTSVDATRAFLRGAQVTPFEAEGQVFVVASAETLSGEAANALLKLLEEPPGRTARHFFLLAPSQFDLLPTLRSRSLAIFLGAGARPHGEALERAAAEFSDALESYRRSGHSGELIAAADILKATGEWKDPRDRTSWERAAAVALECAGAENEASMRRSLLALAADLLEAPRLRMRGIPAERLLEGSVGRRLGGLANPEAR